MSKKQAVSVAFDEAVSNDRDGVSRIMRTIGGESLEPGAYVVRMDITNSRTGQVASAETDLVVVKKG